MIRTLASQLPGETAMLDAQTLLSRVTGHNRAWWISHPEAGLTTEQELIIETAIHKLKNGMPLPYVLGHWEFFGLDFLVTPDVLIPRPETELLVETAISHIRSHPISEYRILDIGTGSGIIPISLAVHVPHAKLVATDISFAALKVAHSNAERHGVIDRIQFIQADLLPGNLISSKFNIICANLPYIPSETYKNLEIYGKEPDIALDGGNDGMNLIRKLIGELVFMKPTECLCLFEIEQRQGFALSALGRESFPNAKTYILKDLNGLDRLLVINS